MRVHIKLYMKDAVRGRKTVRERQTNRERKR